MTQSNRLITVFNANDPTPTARALRNMSWQSAVVLIIGRKHYNKNQVENLKRLESWMKGTARYHVFETNEWPDKLWKKEWDWNPIRFTHVEFLELEDIFTSEIEFDHDDRIDLTSGAKEMAGELIRLVSMSNKSVMFSIQTRSGHSLNLSTGEFEANFDDLSARERIWLSAGYIIDYPGRGSRKLGETLKGVEKLEWKGEYPSGRISKSSAVGLNNELSKIEPNIDKMEKATGKKILLSNPDELKSGYWLEHVSAHLLATWPNVLQTYIGPRLIHPSIHDCLSVAFSTISFDRTAVRNFPNDLLQIPKSLKEKENQRKAQLEFIQDDAVNQKAVNWIARSIHAVEFDVLAVTNSNFIVAECKHMNCVDAAMLGRNFANAKAMFPTQSIPILIYSGCAAMNAYGVDLISWPQLSNPGIFELIKQGAVEEIRYPIEFPAEKADWKSANNQSNVAADLTLENKKKMLKTLLLSVRYSPMPFSPHFFEIAKNLHITRKGPKKLLMFIRVHLAAELNIEIRVNELSTNQWLVWNDD